MTMPKREDCPAFRRAGAHERTIAVDLDGTLFSGVGCKEVGAPISSEIDRLWKLKSVGYYIIIHTARINNECEAAWGPQLDKIIEALKASGCPYDEIWQGRGKPVACHYADDRSFKTVAALYEDLEWKKMT